MAAGGHLGKVSGRLSFRDELEPFDALRQPQIDLIENAFPLDEERHSTGDSHAERRDEKDRGQNAGTDGADA